jgi:glycosyltransferase involved in cell wall biosynthesis
VSASSRSTVDPALDVGLNLMFLGPRAGGIGRYARELPGALLEAEPATRITVFAGRDLPPEVRAEPWADAVRWLILPVGATGPTAQAIQHLVLPGLARAARLDVLHSPANIGPTIAPGVATVVSLMDLIWLTHADQWNPDPAAQRTMRRWVRHSVRHADRIFTITHAAAAEIVPGLGVPASRIAVTPLAVRSDTVEPIPEPQLRARLDLHGARVLLCVAQKRRYKHLEVLVRALPTLAEDVVLVCPGAPTPYEDELRALGAQLGVTHRLRLADWVSEAELAALYRLADALALPSLTVGVGLPVLEAMAQRLPVACSDIPALSEISGDAARLFDPHDQSAVDAALRDVLEDELLRAALVQRGLTQAARYTWRGTGLATLAGYREAIAQRAGGRHRWSRHADGPLA